LKNKKSINLILDPKDFDHYLVEKDEDLKGFLNEICNIFLLKNWKKSQKIKKQKKIITILYLIANIQNM